MQNKSFYSKPTQTPIKCLTKHEMNVNAYTHTNGQTQTHTLTVTRTNGYTHYVYTRSMHTHALC